MSSRINRRPPRLEPLEDRCVPSAARAALLGGAEPTREPLPAVARDDGETSAPAEESPPPAGPGEELVPTEEAAPEDPTPSALVTDRDHRTDPSRGNEPTGPGPSPGPTSTFTATSEDPGSPGGENDVPFRQPNPGGTRAFTPKDEPPPPTDPPDRPAPPRPVPEEETPRERSPRPPTRWHPPAPRPTVAAVDPGEWMRDQRERAQVAAADRVEQRLPTLAQQRRADVRETARVRQMRAAVWAELLGGVQAKPGDPPRNAGEEKAGLADPLPDASTPLDREAEGEEVFSSGANQPEGVVWPDLSVVASLVAPVLIAPDDWVLGPLLEWVDIPAGLGADLAGALLPLDTAALDAALEQFLGTLEEMGAGLERAWGLFTVAPWVVGLAAGATSCEVARRRYKGRRGLLTNTPFPGESA